MFKKIMRNKIAVFTLLVCSLVFVGSNVSAQVGCNINNLQDLDGVRSNLSGSYSLCRNLDFNEDSSYDQNGDWGTKKTNWTTGGGWTPLGVFTGTFDGNGYTVNNLYIGIKNSQNLNENDYSSLFGRLGGAGEIRNLGVINADVTGNYYSGILVGWSDGLIENCYTGGQILAKNSSTGGLVGYNSNSVSAEIRNSYNLADITGEASGIGGLVGSNNGGLIDNSYNEGVVFSTGGNVGGLAGQNSSGTIQNSYNTGSVSSEDNEMGGLVGRNVSGTITDSYNEGDVNGKNDVGGLAGYNSGTIEDSYNTGNITTGINSHIGGLIGINYGTVTRNYSIGTISTGVGSFRVGGLVGYSFSGTISLSYSKGTINSSDYVGGLVGFNQSTIENSYSISSVFGRDRVGGLVGDNLGASARIINSYAVGDVEGNNYLGGLIGMNTEGIIENSYSTSSVSGSVERGGLVGRNNQAFDNSFWYDRSNGISCTGYGTDYGCSSVDNISYFFNYQNEPISNWTFDADYWDSVHSGYDHPVFTYQGEVEREGEDEEGVDSSPQPVTSSKTRGNRVVPWFKNPIYRKEVNEIILILEDMDKKINKLILLFSN